MRKIDLAIRQLEIHVSETLLVPSGLLVPADQAYQKLAYVELALVYLDVTSQVEFLEEDSADIDSLS